MQCVSSSQNAVHPTSVWSEVDFLLLLGTVGHVLSLGASSFVEEEHQTWYFLVNTLCLALSQETFRSYFLGDNCEPQHHFHMAQGCEGTVHTLQYNTGYDAPEPNGENAKALGGHRRWAVLASPWLVLACCRLLRSLNQTGVQGAHRPDFGHWFTR
jgi:ethanolaminephosphotransferase